MIISEITENQILFSPRLLVLEDGSALTRRDKYISNWIHTRYYDRQTRLKTEGDPSIQDELLYEHFDGLY